MGRIRIRKQILRKWKTGSNQWDRFFLYVGGRGALLSGQSIHPRLPSPASRGKVTYLFAVIYLQVAQIFTFASCFSFSFFSFSIIPLQFIPCLIGKEFVSFSRYV